MDGTRTEKGWHQKLQRKKLEEREEAKQKDKACERKKRETGEVKDRGTNQGKPLTGREEDQREGWTTRDR